MIESHILIGIREPELSDLKLASRLRRYQHLTKLPDSLMDGLTTMKSAISQLKQSKTYKIQKATGIHSQLPNQIRPACKMNIYIYINKNHQETSPHQADNKQIINVTLSPNKKNTAPSFRHCYFEFGQFRGPFEAAHLEI